MDLRFLVVLFRQKRAIVLAFLVLFALAFVLVLLRPPAYRSEAKLLVQVGRESVTLDPTAAIGGPTLDPRASWENELNSELEIARSDELRRKVVETLGAATILGEGSGTSGDGPGWLARGFDAAAGLVRRLVPGDGSRLTEEDEAALLIADELDVRLVLDSSVIKISYASSDPELARSVVSAYIDQYLEKHLDAHRTPGSLEFFQEETSRLEQELDAREEDLRTLLNKSGIGSVEEQRHSLIERLGAREQEVALSDASVAASAAKVSALENALEEGKLPETVVIQEVDRATTPVADFLKQQLHTLRLQEQSLLAAVGPESQGIRGVRDQIALAERLLAGEETALSETTRGANPSRQGVELALVNERALLASLHSRVESLREGEARLRAELEQLTNQELLIKRLRREIAELEANYLRYSANLEQTRADQALHLEKISNVRVLQPATLPLRSTTMGRKVTLALGGMLALVGALATAFVVEALDQSPRTPEGLRRRLGVTPIARLMDTRSLRRGRRIALAPGPELAKVRAHVLDGDEREPRMIAVLAPGRGDGASTVAANLAASLAELGRSEVLLVDASLLAPSVQDTFGVPLVPGLAEAVQEGTVPAPRASGHAHLSLVTAGDPRGLGLLSFDRVARELPRWWSAWKKDYAHVIVDLPAFVASPLVAQVAAASDAVVLVVAAEKDRWQVARQALEGLEESRAPLAGVVLNQCFSGPGWLSRRI